MPLLGKAAEFKKIKLRSLFLLQMDTKATADVTSYMLFEATGDSEADCDSIMDDFACGIACADDDAQSCSYDRSDSSIVDELGKHESCEPDDEHKDEKKLDQEEPDNAYGASYCEDDDMQKHQKSDVSVSSGQELVDEMEKNRLFWEACLAS